MTAKQLREILEKRKQIGRPIPRWYIAEQCGITETLLSRIVNSRIKDKDTLAYISDFVKKELAK